MQIEEVVQIIGNRLATLNNGRAQAVAVGDLAAVMTIDAQIEETKLTLEQLRAVHG